MCIRDSLSATRRLISQCSARNTVPMPPSAIGRRILYRPSTTSPGFTTSSMPSAFSLHERATRLLHGLRDLIAHVSALTLDVGKLGLTRLLCGTDKRRCFLRDD